MDELIECVPNFSEGRRPETVAQLVAVITAAGALVLDTHSDADHNRTVITFVGTPANVVAAAVRAAAVAVELIDLRQHTGQHPRVGALDVLPFVPVRGVTLADCAQLAHEAGARIAQELQVPVYFYGAAARNPLRARLEDVRRKGFEQLRAEIELDAAWTPDAGAARVHESAGACVVGARPLLVAYNVNLHTADVSIARRIARAVRGRDGGLRYLKALGFALPERGLTQVSMNLVQFERTTLHHAFAAVQREAARWGVQVAGSELVGLVPQAALDRSAEYFLQLENYAPAVVLENRIAAALAARPAAPAAVAPAAASEVRATSAPDVAPATSAPVVAAPPQTAPLRVPAAGVDLAPADLSGGGAAAAYVGALAAALGEMLARLVERRARPDGAARVAGEALQALPDLRARLTEAADEDAAAFARVLAARRLARGSADERRVRAQAVEEALKGATTVPLEVASLAVQVGELLETLAETGEPAWLADAAAGAQLARAAVAAGRYNVLVNTAELEDEEFAAEHRARADDFRTRAREIVARIEEMLLDTV